MKDVIEALCTELDIPMGHYELARDRHRSIGKHLKRDESEVVQWRPHIYPQGSFRYGTVVKPITGDGEYDLDIVCELQEQTKVGTTQKALKEAVGRELVAYATGNNMKSMPKEGRKCWHLPYADHVSFHIDVLPAIPEGAGEMESIAAASRELDASGQFAQLAIAITDKKRRDYGVRSSDWPSSNPRGYARWFEGRMRAAAETRIRWLVESRRYRTIDDVPAYEWKTPLQRSIQVLKRHRDVMFKGNSDYKPISMIITTLAANAYAGEPNVEDALPAIVEGMSAFVRPSGIRVPNPVYPSEDFADKWREEPDREQWFWTWMKQVKRDVSLLGTGRDLTRHLDENFAVRLPHDQRDRIIVPAAAAAAAPSVQIKDRPRPWGNGLA